MFLLRFFLLLICLLIWASGSVKAQYNQYRVYTSNDGLNRTETYDVIVGASGELWTYCCNHKVNMFNGRIFEENDISNNVIDGLIRIRIQYDSMIWLVSSNGPPFYLDGKKSCQPPGGEDIRSIGLSRSHGIIGFDPSGQLYIYSKESNSWEKGRKLQLTPDSLVKTRSLKADRNSDFNYIYETLNNNETRNWKLIDINQGIVERINVSGIFRVVSWSENGFY